MGTSDQVVQLPVPPLTTTWGNALPVLHEIRHALERLIDEGESTAIDLRALPFGAGDEAELLAALGRGEVEVSLEALGPSRIWETVFPGVWVVDHQDPDGRRIALSIEITRIPELLLSQPADLRSALVRLDRTLAADSSPPARSPHNDLRSQHG